MPMIRPSGPTWPTRASRPRTMERGAASTCACRPTPRNKFSFFWDRQSTCTSCLSGGTAIIAPEAKTKADGFPLDIQQITWQSPRTNRLLLEARFGNYLVPWGGRPPVPNPTQDLVRIVEQCTIGCAANGGIPGLTYRSL